MKLLTIVTVTYNAEHCIERTLRSVVGQSMFDEQIEYIVVDGASNDGTMQIVNRFREKLAHVISEKDHGIYDAMNKGISLASTPWICFMNADDTFFDEHTVEQLHLEQRVADHIIYGDALWVNALTGIEIIRKACPFFDNPDKCSGLGICHQSIYTPTQWMKDMPFTTSGLHYCNDYDFFFKQWKRGCRFEYIALPLCRFSYGDGWSSEAKVGKRILEENARISHTRYGFWYWRHIWRRYKCQWFKK